MPLGVWSIIRVGIATDAVNDDNTRITLAVDAVHPNDNTEYVNSGVEYSWANIVSLRGGWKSVWPSLAPTPITAAATATTAPAAAISSAAITAAAAAATGRPVFARTRFVHRQSAALKILLME